MVAVGTSVVDNIMKIWGIGKYALSTSQNENAPTAPVETIITSPDEPKPEVQSEKGANKYFSKLSKLTHKELCVEFANVMVAKYNLMSFPAAINEYSDRQATVTDLTDKALLICISQFGQPAILRYSNGDFRPFNGLINQINEYIMQEDLSPEQHGALLLSQINENL